ncbi:solute carrier family 35 member E2B isoform X4 [Tamandua tetradactyla]|uniref:solute carrier family 35 member E2B isoform X4 n=1 Tax=Tamandua tetradactyla TaxID=48850 RepID=UPI004053C0C5
MPSTKEDCRFALRAQFQSLVFSRRTYFQVLCVDAGPAGGGGPGAPWLECVLVSGAPARPPHPSMSSPPEAPAPDSSVAGPSGRPRGRWPFLWGPLLGRPSEPGSVARGTPGERVLAVTLTETTVIEAPLGAGSSRALLYLVLWFIFSVCTLFLNKHILSLLEGEPSTLDAVHNLHRVCEDPGALLPAPAQGAVRLPAQLPVHHALRGPHEVRHGGPGPGEPEECGCLLRRDSEELCPPLHRDHVPDGPWGVHRLAGQPVPHPCHGGAGAVHRSRGQLQRLGLLGGLVHQHHGLFAKCFLKEAPQWGQIQVLGPGAAVLHQRRCPGHADPSLGLVHGHAGDRGRWQDLHLQPGRGAAARGGWHAVPPAECHGLRAHGQDLPRHVQRRQRREACAVHLAQRHRVRQQDHQPVSHRHCPGDRRRPPLQQGQATPAGDPAQPGLRPHPRRWQHAPGMQGPCTPPLSTLPRRCPQVLSAARYTCPRSSPAQDCQPCIPHGSFTLPTARASH